MTAVFPYVLVFNQILVFEPCEKIDRCLDVNIDDYKVEENEELTIILENIDERNNIVLMDGTIVVMDDDCECYVTI